MTVAIFLKFHLILAYKSKCHFLCPLIPKHAFDTEKVDRHNFLVKITLD